MKTQAWGWLTAAVLTAGLNASYHDGGLQWAHRIVDQVGHNSAAVLALASGRADQFLTEARILTARNETASCRWATTLAQVQTRIAGAENAFAHAEKGMADTETGVADAETGFADVENGWADAENGLANVEVMSAWQQAHLARLQASRDRIEARMAARAARLHVAATAFNPELMKSLEVPVNCPRVRVHIPRLPMVRVPAPEVHVDMGAGPV